MSKKKPKIRHNKKRNTAFLYEALVREITKSILTNDKERRHVALSLCKEHFAKDTILYKEFELYNTLLETKEVEVDIAEKILNEVKKEREKIDDVSLFNEQTSLINKINKQLGGSTFSNFIPNYKNLASVGQIFQKNSTIKNKVLVEKEILELMVSSEEKLEEKKLKTIDELTYKVFVTNFNEKYNNSLLEEQRKLISNYIMSNTGSDIELKIFLNEEVGRLRKEVEKLLEDKDIKDDTFMVESVKGTLNILNSTAEREICKDTIKKVLKIQQLVHESKKMDNE